ncbi:MAG: hypothetical protein RIS26_243 [Actinomycetota bacterium]|jgi:preprotein translocase subunit YajC
MEQYLPLLVAGAFIVFMVMNNRKQKAKQAEMQTKVVVGAQVMLTSGIYGEIKSINEDRVVLKSAGTTTLEVARGAVLRVVDNAPAADAKPAAKKTTAKK